MPDVTPAGTEASEKTLPPADPTQTANTQTSGNPDKISALETQVASLVNAISRLQRLNKPAPAQAEKPSKDDELETARAQIIALRDATNKQTRQVAIARALMDLGFESEHHEILADHIEARHGSRIKVDGLKVIFENDLGEELMPKDYIGKLFEGAKGDRFKTVKAGPNAKGLRGNDRPSIAGKKRYSDMTPSELSKLPPDQERALRLEDRD